MSAEAEPTFTPKLDQIETQWSLLLHAHNLSESHAVDALNSLVLRYSPAIRGYVRMLTQNNADADDLAQEVVVRLLKGDFSGADPKRGRFRDLLMVAVKNMVRNHWERSNRRPKTGIEIPEAPEKKVAELHLHSGVDGDWLSQWRSALIDIGMSRLKLYQTENPGNVAYLAMQLRSSFPTLDSVELAARMSQMTGREISAATYRQHLKRSRVRFAEYIVEEIAQGLPDADVSRVQDELIEVGLFEYIRDVLPDAWQARAESRPRNA